MIYHFFSALLQPFTILLLAALFAAAILWRRSIDTRRRRLMAITPLLLLTFCCLPVVGYFAMGSLEWQYDSLEARPPGVSTIVVLAGWAHRPNDQDSELVLGTDSRLRCLRTARLYASAEPCLVVVSGGKVLPDDQGPPLAELMRDYLMSLGVKQSDILVEAESRNTHENAKLTAEMLHARDIREVVLVTSAAHIPRAVRCFEAEGIDAAPSGCDRQATQFVWSPLQVVPSIGAAGSVQAAYHEWMGLLVYWWRGYV